MPPANPNAVVLLSGGLDSTTVLAIARHEGFACHTLSFNYGQRHHQELQAAEKIALKLGAVEHCLVPINTAAFGGLRGSALTDDIDVPKDRRDHEIASGIPVTYVPARNTLFLSYALAWAEVLGASDIFIGVNAVDYSGYPDCRPAFIAAFQTMARLATKAGVENTAPVTVHTPLIDLPKTQIIRRGLELGVDYGMTHSCYDPTPEGRPCRRCDSCHLRADAFAALNMPDPVLGSPS